MAWRSVSAAFPRALSLSVAAEAITAAKSSAAATRRLIESRNASTDGASSFMSMLPRSVDASLVSCASRTVDPHAATHRQAEFATAVQGHSAPVLNTKRSDKFRERGGFNIAPRRTSTERARTVVQRQPGTVAPGQAIGGSEMRGTLRGGFPNRPGHNVPMVGRPPDRWAAFGVAAHLRFN